METNDLGRQLRRAANRASGESPRDRADDLRLREVLRQPKDLMRPGNYSPERGITKWPTRYAERTRLVRQAAIVGSPADLARQALGIPQIGEGQTADGQPTVYVPRATDARTVERASANEPRLIGDESSADRVARLARDLRLSAGIVVLGGFDN